ncbi:MAG: hypothetical protein GF350_04805 [Chitinivibrionales bacterium]|nr:hypothetical protein [Chitinivibrionales bacterium]
MAKFKDIIRELKSGGVGYDIAKVIEQIYRLETNHFTSRQYIATHSPGMEGFAETYPYGWITLDRVLWSKNPDIKPIGLVHFRDNHTGQMRPFLVFKNLRSAVFTLLGFINYYGNPYRWNSTDPEKQTEYKYRLSKINTPIVNNIYYE